MKKIMITHEKMVIGGIERVLLNTLKSIDLNKYEIDLYLKKSGGDFFNQIPSKVNVIVLENKSKIFIKEKNNIIIKIIRRLLGIKNYYSILFKKYYQKKQYDISVSFGGLDKISDLFAGVAPAKKKYIWCHGDFMALSEYTNWFKKTFDIEKYKYDCFDKVIAVSKTAAKNFLKIYEKETSIEYIWNLTDYKDIILKSKEKTNAVLKGKYKIVFIGRMSDDKALDMLIYSIKKVMDEKIEITTYIVGDGKNYDKINNIIKKNKLQKSIILLGENRNPYNILKQADLLVLPSRNEGFPTVLIESLVLGIPFVATNVCGSSDIHNYVSPKGASILTERSIDSLADGIKRAYFGEIKKGFKFDYKKYNEKILKKLLKLFNN